MPRREDESPEEFQERVRNRRRGNKPPPPPVPPPPPPDDDTSEYPTDPHWPGPTSWSGKGPPPADTLHPRGTKGWKQALDPRRKWVGDELWKAQAQGRLNLSDKKAVSDFLRGLDITDEQGGGRHLRNLFLGNLPEEGFGASPIRPDISWGMERYMPDWKQGMDRAVQGGHLMRDPVTGFYVNKDPRGDLANPEWYNSMGELVPPPYAGAYKTQKQLDEERAFAEQEAAAKPITLTNVPGATNTPAPASTPAPAPTTTAPPAITGYSEPAPTTSPLTTMNPSPSSTVSSNNNNQDAFYTSPTPPAAGTSFNFNVGSTSPSRRSETQSRRNQRQQPRPAAGWSGTWA